MRHRPDEAGFNVKVNGHCKGSRTLKSGGEKNGRIYTYGK